MISLWSTCGQLLVCAGDAMWIRLRCSVVVVLLLLRRIEAQSLFNRKVSQSGQARESEREREKEESVFWR